MQILWLRSAGLAAVLGLAACVTRVPETPAPVARSGVPANPGSWRALIVAANDREPVFDAARRTLETDLQRLGVAASAIESLSAAGDDGRPRASPAALTQAATRLASVPADRCLVFLTSHGNQRGLELTASRSRYSSEALDQLVDRACGSLPTVVVVSACYSGVFADPPVPRPNRIVATAAQRDRTSFGCSHTRTYTVYDGCLIEALRIGGGWVQLFGRVKTCVEAEERTLGVRLPSNPQLVVGAGVAILTAPRP